MSAFGQLNFLQALGWALLNSLWQIALLWVCYNLLLSFFPKIKPAIKTSLATLLLTTGFGWFLFSFFTNLFFSPSTDFYNKWPGIINKNAWSVFIEKVLVVSSIIYIIILFIHAGKFVRNYKYVQAIRTRGLSKIKAEWRIFIKRKSAYMGIAKKVEIWLSDLVQTPVTIGYLKPVILIPVAAINHLSTHQVEAILLHELSHIRRHDYIYNLVINFIKTILYFNPFVKLFVKTIERERENSCDEMVMRFPFQPTEYASALLLLEKNNQQQIMMAAAGNNHDLLHRVEAILGIRRKNNQSFRQAAISFFILLGIAFMNILFSLDAKNEIRNFVSLNGEVSPYYFFKATKNQDKKNTADFFAAQKPGRAAISATGPSDKKEIIETTGMPLYQLANYSAPVIPELAKEDELQLKETIGATKKILEEKEWKEVEKNYADVYNSNEKARLKNEYQQQINNIDWNNLETKLRLSYNNIDWNKVTDQVRTSLAQIKLDSIQAEIKCTFDQLITLESWMKKNNTTTIPDSDVTLELVKDNKQKAKAELNKIKAVISRKIIRL